MGRMPSEPSASGADRNRRADDMREVDQAIADRLAVTPFGDILGAKGVTTVALDGQGRIVEYRPDGTSTIVSPDLGG